MAVAIMQPSISELVEMRKDVYWAIETIKAFTSADTARNQTINEGLQIIENYALGLMDGEINEHLLSMGLELCQYPICTHECDELGVMPMTNEELFQITKLIGIRLYELGDNTVTAYDKTVATLSKREIVALATGITSANVIANLTPPVPIDQLTIGDIGNVTQAIVGTLVNTLNQMGLLFPKDGASEEGDAND